MIICTVVVVAHSLMGNRNLSLFNELRGRFTRDQLVTNKQEFIDQKDMIYNLQKEKVSNENINLWRRIEYI